MALARHLNANAHDGRPGGANRRHAQGPRAGRRLAGVAGALAAAAALTLPMVAPAAAAGPAGPDDSAATTGARVTGTVHANGGLVRRSKPTVHTPAFGAVPDRSTVKIDCQIKGTSVQGNRHWYQIVSHGILDGWVSGEYVRIDGDIQPRWCTPGVSTAATTTKATAGFEGPSGRDREVAAVDKGAGIGVWCYTETHDPRPGHAVRWFASMESGWIRASAVTPSEPVPYCQA